MSLTFVNHYSFTPGHRIYVAIMWSDPNSCANVGARDGYTTSGWYAIEPGGSNAVLTGDLRKLPTRYIAYYAESYDRAVTWAGNVGSWASDSPFHLCHGEQCSPCRFVNFRTQYVDPQYVDFSIYLSN